MAVPCAGVSVEDEAQLGSYDSSDWAKRQFCRTCGTSLFWRLREGDGHVAVAFQAFDDLAHDAGVNLDDDFRRIRLGVRRDSDRLLDAAL